METPTANFIQMMLERAKSLQAEGNLNDALHAVNAAVDKSERDLGPEPSRIDSFARSLEKRADLYIELGQYEDAEGDLKSAIDQFDNRQDRYAQVGKLYALLGAAYDGQDRTDLVSEAWQTAVYFFEKHEPPLSMDVAAMSNNLGFTAKACGDLGAAEDYFLKALDILNSKVGPKHEQTASVASNLGAVYLAAGYIDQARETHMMALEARQELFGENHPDTAQSHNNLALALVLTGDRAAARQHFEKALVALETLGSAYADDLDAVASNYCDFLKDEGDTHLAETIDGRVKNLLLVGA